MFNVGLSQKNLDRLLPYGQVKFKEVGGLLSITRNDDPDYWKIPMDRLYIEVRAGTELTALDHGTVVRVNNYSRWNEFTDDRFHNNHLIVIDYGGIYGVHSHVSSKINVGDKVRQDDPIGNVRRRWFSYHPDHAHIFLFKTVKDGFSFTSANFNMPQVSS